MITPHVLQVGQIVFCDTVEKYYAVGEVSEKRVGLKMLRPASTRVRNNSTQHTRFNYAGGRMRYVSFEELKNQEWGRYYGGKVQRSTRQTSNRSTNTWAPVKRKAGIYGVGSKVNPRYIS